VVVDFPNDFKGGQRGMPLEEVSLEKSNEIKEARIEGKHYQLFGTSLGAKSLLISYSILR
jgi:hypothetical protein